MGANAQTSVPTFTSGEILTAANMNISARTGVPVFADTTARDAAFGGTGEKTLAEGQLCYVENLTGDAQIQYYDGSTWNSLGAPGLTLIKTQTIGTSVTSVTVTGAFSADYDAYKIIISDGATSANNDNLNLQLGSTTTGYYGSAAGTTYASTASALATENNAASWQVGFAMTDSLNVNIELVNPFLSKNTYLHASMISSVNARNKVGVLINTTSYTAFTLTAATASSLTGGTIRVYGYRN